MNNTPQEQAKELLQQAEKAYKAGNDQRAYFLALQASRTAPELEEPWLLLASLSGPEESIKYLRKALEHFPKSERARKGLQWAIKRYREEQAKTQQSPTIIPEPAGEKTQEIELKKPVKQLTEKKKTSSQKKKVETKKRKSSKTLRILTTVFIVLIACGSLFVAAGFIPDMLNNPVVGSKSFQSAALPKATITSTATATNTATITPTATFTATITSTPTNTFTPSPTSTNTTAPPLPTFTQGPEYSNPPITTGEGRWIDVNLSTQQLFAYENDSLVNSFLVSTGTYEHPTVTGQYKIYVKYLYTDMSGPGYYLPDVPYTMYFYSGYGIHGTYWHNNFGTPMSHGCVNMRTEDAGWLYNWASVGTVVNIHY